jgi:hypothetical protein
MRQECRANAASKRDSRDGKEPHYSARLNILCREKHSPEQNLRHAEVSSTSGAGLFFVLL